MRILVHGRFYPSIGGIETVVNLLACEWAYAGQEVAVVSNLAGKEGWRRGFPFRVIYKPGALHWLRLVKWSQVVLHMNLSLKALWPHLVLKRPLVVSHHSCYRSYASHASHSLQAHDRSSRDRLKLCFTTRVTNIAASQAIQRSLSTDCQIVPNPYDATLFNEEERTIRDGDLVYVGRLIPEKGVSLLLTALKRLPACWDAVRLTILGDGPERDSLERQAIALGLSHRVCFLGAMDQQNVAIQLRRHRVLVVPSVYEEPFGVVALEGAACGCVVLGSQGGGLPEAIGPAGITFLRGNAEDLTAQLERLLAGILELARRRRAVREHLERHHPRRIATEYLRILRSKGGAPRGRTSRRAELHVVTRGPD